MFTVLFQIFAIIVVAILALAVLRALWMTIEVYIGPVNPFKKSPMSTEIGGAFPTFCSSDMTHTEYCQKSQQHELHLRAMSYQRREIELSMQIEHEKRMRQIAGVQETPVSTQSHTASRVVGSSTTTPRKEEETLVEAVRRLRVPLPYQRITKPSVECTAQTKAKKQKYLPTDKGEITRIRLH